MFSQSRLFTKIYIRIFSKFLLNFFIFLGPFSYIFLIRNLRFFLILFLILGNYFWGALIFYLIYFVSSPGNPKIPGYSHGQVLHIVVLYLAQDLGATCERGRRLVAIFGRFSRYTSPHEMPYSIMLFLLF